MAKKRRAPDPETADANGKAPPLRLEWRSPAELAENPRNWRRHPEGQVAALTDVLGEVGWAGACLYNEATGRLIDGHARKKVALAQGTDKVPVLVGSWTEAQEAKILATLDPLAAMAQADTAALDALLRAVQTESQAIGEMLADLSRKAGLYHGAGTPVDDPQGEWQGMPEFRHEDKTAFRSLIVHFADQSAIDDFSRRVEQTFSAETKFLYHPKREAEHERQRYDESEVSSLHHQQEPLGEPAHEQ